MPSKTISRTVKLFQKALSSPRLPLIMFLAGPLLVYMLVEILNNNHPLLHFSPLQIGLNLALYLSAFCLIYLLLGRLKLAAGVASAFFYAIGTINHYVFNFRGRTLFPSDFTSITTALNVADSYDYTPDGTQIATFVVLCVYLAALALSPRARGRAAPPLKISVVLSSMCLALFGVFFGTGAVDALGLEPSMWSTRGNGLLLNFSLSLKCSIGSEPEQYDGSKVSEIASTYSSDCAQGDTRPNIIAIMNESYADLRVLGSFETNGEITPYLDSLMDETISGYTYSSVFGGTTANAEYEFLTGNTMAMLPEGSVPYQLYIDEDVCALPGQLRALGYSTVAMHPYDPTGWNRVPVYENLGFDEALFIDDFKNRGYMRNYVTDRSNYENLIRVYEEKARSDNPLFIFNITMQNHGAYSVDYNGLPRTVWLEGGLAGKYPTVDQHLSLMRESDLALKYLIEYFEKIEEPCVIVLFGDHQPQVSSSFFEDILRGEIEELPVSRLQKRQMTPYFIWANYPLEKSSAPRLSMNYLAALMLEAAGLPTTGYQKFLLELMVELPVINTIGYIDKAGNHLQSREELAPSCRTLLDKYEMLQYCEIFDTENRPHDFYFLS